jgi:solute carrier family 38 (sodium-coupled neutral amino acid transporter), member 11
MQVVALCNAYTCQLLLSACLATKTTTFEELAAAVGGRHFMHLLQVANIVLLAGNLTGDISLLSDLGSKVLLTSLGSDAPALLTANHGRGVMLLLVVTVILPLSCLRQMRALELASSAGVVVLLALCGILTADAVSVRFAGITSGEVPVWTLKWFSGDAAQAFALLGFSFYLHPLMMPMLAELPAGPAGVRIMSESVTLVVLGFALVIISYIAAMGAAAFGRDTQGDIMLNHLLDQRWARVAFTAAMLVYLSSCIPPLVLSLRSYLDFILAGPRAPYRARRFHTLTLSIVMFPLVLAWREPRISQQTFAFTGATGVCVVCYVVPVLTHFRLMYRQKAELPSVPQSEAIDSTVNLPLLSGSRHRSDGGQAASEWVYASPPTDVRGWLQNVAVPVAVLVIGSVLSGIAVCNALL